MIDLETVMLRRAEEQVRAERISGYQERDSWEVVNTAEPPRLKKRSHCLAGDCSRPVRGHGYCHVHEERIRNSGDIDGRDWWTGRPSKGAE